MKVIDLLNKIANGEVKDKEKFRIKYLCGLTRKIYYDENEGCYLKCLKNVSDEYVIYDDVTLNDEVEIIEEDKEIEKIEELSIRWKDNDIIVNGKVMQEDIDEVFVDKINELIKAVNELKKGK